MAHAVEASDFELAYIESQMLTELVSLQQAKSKVENSYSLLPTAVKIALQNEAAAVGAQFPTYWV